VQWRCQIIFSLVFRLGKPELVLVGHRSRISTLQIFLITVEMVFQIGPSHIMTEPWKNMRQLIDLFTAALVYSAA